ncbi:outer membrane adhesin like protein (plasmid) [Stanieria cyanosphaera PCC 7437]|uniref:Outer membrane adhesin like protein n=1 Tax=Stanieria cyanosphaera (strain ATCC 29371 / PCC 7437) TaxID=111780 RepID=K9Y093_STAC7|nr:outer membrane adhesin like protein [Stanieria cyanosphaera PCC 7437]
MFEYGGESYSGIVIPELSDKLGNNRYQLAVEVPQTVVLGESLIKLERVQEELNGTEPGDIEQKTYVSETGITIQPDDVELTLAPQAYKDQVSVFNALNPEEILAFDGLTSRDLLLAQIPVGNGQSFDDEPRDLVATHDATRAYVSLRSSGRIAVIDLMSLQQVDTLPETSNIIDPIQLPINAAPHAIATSADDRYLYVGDYRTGTLYIVDIDSRSDTYHKVIETISIAEAANGFRSLAINSDGKKLFATVPGSYSSNSKGKVYVFNIDPEDKPKELEDSPGEFEPNTEKWHEIIGVIEVEKGVEGISATPDPNVMIFANRQEDSQGFGRLKITNDKPTEFAAKTSYTALGLGSTNDYFDVNEAMSIAITSDSKYGFVAGRNSRLMGSGIPSIDGPKAGSNVGIIVDPLTENAKLIAATRPIPNAWTSDVTLSSDDKYLFAAYPGVGGVYAWDVEEMIETIDDPSEFKIDHRGRGIASPVFNPNTAKNATKADFSSVPIDNINPDITLASDLQLTKDEYRFDGFESVNDVEFGVPEDSVRAPLTVGFNPWSVANVNHRDWLDLLPVDDDNITENSTPTFKWEYDEGFEDVEEVNLFVSSFPKDKGLLPWDELVDLSDPDFLSDLSESEKKALITRSWQKYNDFNPGRILTATWKKDTDTWYWHDGTTIIPQPVSDPANNQNRFTLPDLRALTNGQTYYWAVEAFGKQGTRNIDFGRFETVAPPSTNPFSSVSILTHGFTLLPGSTGIDSATYDLAAAIADSQRNEPDEQGLILRYDKPTGQWIPIDEKQNVLDSVTGGLDTDDPNYLSTVASNIKANYQNKPLVLIPEWSLDYESVLPISGFTEGAADAIFASMVQLDQALGGEIGITNDAGELTQLYDDEGDLIRTYGDLFSSPLHFIGFSRGTVVNSEIIQRLGTYYPHAGGAVYIDTDDGNKVKPVVDASGNKVRDLQMTTIDPHDFKQDSLNVGLPLPGLGTILDFKDFNEPEVTVWDNVTFADNYFQNIANPSGGTWTPNGRNIDNADVNVPLNGRSGFIKDNGIGAPHTGVFAWYAGTVDFALDEVTTGYQITKSGIPIEPIATKIYDRLGSEALESLALDSLGEEDISQLLDLSAANPALTGWYLKDDENNSEGIGEGWYYSILGGGQRPDVDLSDRTPVSEDNTDPNVEPGDFAVPTVFNGNFDYGINNTPGQEVPNNLPVPGWSYHNGEGTQPLRYEHLVDVDDIDTIVESEQIDEPLLDDAVAPLMAALTVQQQKNRAAKLGGGNPKAYRHNLVNVPEWGDLRFDLHVHNLNNGQIKVSLSSTVPGFENYNFAPINLTSAIGSQPEYEDDRYRIGYGKNGFETFSLDVPDELRGKVVSLNFEVVGSETVYLDNVFFQSQHLLLGNPTEARQPDDTTPYIDNYLLEKPQFSVSYSKNDNIPNWSAWQLNSNWTGNASRPKPDKFFGDPMITSLGWVGVDHPTDYEREYSDGTPKTNLPQINPKDGKPYKLAPGHLVSVSQRSRSLKDIWSTYLTTNIVPQFDKLNTPVWNNLENHFEKKLVTRTNDRRELYIYSGSVGTKSDKPSINITDQPDSPYDIRVPEDLWRVIVVLERPGLGLADINPSNTKAFALIAANELPTPGQAPFDPWYTNGNIELTNIASLEKELNLDPTNKARGITYNFLSNLPVNVRTAIKNQTFPVLPPNTKPVDAFLLADSNNANSFVTDTTINPNSVPIDIFFKKNMFDVSTNEASISQIASSNFSRSQVSTSQISTSQISIPESSHTKPSISQISSTEVGTIQTSGVEKSSTEISPTQVAPFEIRFGQIQSTEVDSAQIGINNLVNGQFVASKIPYSTSIKSEDIFVLEQWFVTHVFAPNSSVKVSDTLNSLWNYNLSTPFDINFQITDLPSGQLAETTITSFDENGVPNAGTILIDHDANGVGWFVDETPLDNSEFITQNTDSYLLATTESEANGKYDLLTTVLHELAHLYGFIDGYQGFDANLETKNGTTKFIGDDFEAVLDGEHLDKQAHPYDLLNTHLAPEVRKLPSELDVEILKAILADESQKIDGIEKGLDALLTSDPLRAIANGDFSITDTTSDTFAWNTRGDSNIEQGQAVLTEDSPFLSNFTQTFTIPEDAKTLQFTLVDTELGASELAPPDAFEVALLDANTNEPLTTDTNLSNTDSLLNIQNDGTTYFSNNVRIGGATSGQIIDLNNSRTITIDISHLAPGTEATLYFDLLGFGDADSRVVIDDIILSDQNLLLPFANHDTATTIQGQEIEIAILDNDRDDDGTIALNSVQIQTQPDRGTAIARPDGTVSYIPGTGFAGTDTFTYLVSDNDGQLSNPATVTVTVDNVAPTITDIQIPDNITEGTEIELEAIATDSGNDPLTYKWEFDDQTTLFGRTVVRTYVNNGTYTGTVTVTDTYGGSETQTFTVTVDNTPPIVDAGADKTTNEGKAIALTGSFTDAGVNDTHTYTWDLGDGSDLITDTTTPTHTYTQNGIYTATFTVTDSDGAVSNDTVEVTVNNVNPTIESLTGDTNLDEGDTANFSATASDPGDDTLTYIWDFGDGNHSTLNSNQSSVSHTYTQNGTYTVTLTVTDDGGATAQTLEITVNNVAPTIDEIDGKTTVDEGETVSYRAIATDPGDDELIYTWNFGDGSDVVTGETVTHTFANNGVYEATLTVEDDDGAATTQTITITVNNVAPIIETETTKTADEGESLEFLATLSDPGDDELTVTWDFGDGSEFVQTNGSSPRQDTQTHTYVDNGNYTATVTVTDSDGAETTSSIDVTINNTAPVIDSLTGDTKISEGQTANFSANATDAGNDELTYSWDFGDGSDLVTGVDVNHIFADNGNYTVTLTVTDDDGAATSQTINVVVNNVTPVITSLTGDTEILEGEVAEYNAIASDNGNDTLIYTWNFGDGSDTVEGQNVTHVFTDNGNYTVTLTVIDDDGAATSSSLDVTVNNVIPAITSLTGDTNINEGDEASFSAIASDDGEDELTYSWNFGDGTDVVEGENVTHVFTDNGNYTVTLTVTDDDGAATSSTLDVVVNNVMPTITSITGDTNINEGEIRNYQAIASDLGDDTLTYTWNFGDGSDTVEGQNVTHVFADNGNYTVTLTVTDDDGASTSQTLDVVVNNVTPVITSLTGDTEINEGEIGEYNAIATDRGSDELTYSWDFGDGTDIIEGSNVTHVFADNGNYTVTLTVTDDDGASTSQTLDVVVNNVTPVITSLTGDTNLNEGEAGSYSATSEAVAFGTASDPGNDTLTYTWDFGDGSDTVEGESVTHIFADNGNYTVTLTVTDDDGASTSSTLDVVVNNVTPVITSLTGNTNINEGKIGSYQAIAIDNGTDELTYTWNFGDGSDTLEGESVTHIFADNGNYTVTLTVTDDDGAATSSTLNVFANNVGPEIVNLTHSELLEKGRVLNFNVTATDVENDPLTITWNFGDGSAEVTGASVTHRYNDDGKYIVTVTARDDDGGITSNSFELFVEQVFNIKAEGIVTINGNSDLDGEPSRSDDDTKIYAGLGFNLNGNLTLPVQRDAAGNLIRSGNKLILVDRAVTVAPGYLSSNASSNNKNKYANLIPPQVIEPLTVNVPEYNSLVTQKLNQTIPAGTPTITFNTAQNPLNNSTDWLQKFPASGSTNVPTVVRVINGGLNIPSGVNLSNYVIKVDSGDINFNGSGHNLTNVILQTNNGNINLAQINANNLSSFASGSINTNSGARFVGNSLLASANPNGSINFNGATTNIDSSSNLKVISSGNIIFNGAAATRGELVAGKNLTLNGNSDLYGEIATRGNITINGGINLIKPNPTPVSTQSIPNFSPTLTSFSGDTIVTTNTPVNYQAVVNDVDSRSLDVTWNFGDGSQPITQSVNNSTAGSKNVDVIHTFTTEGTYPVTATVSDGEGGITSNEVKVTVDSPVASLPEGLYDLALTGGMAGLSQVGGEEGSTVELSFNLVGADAFYESEVGVLIFDNSVGQIDDLLPSDVGYVEAALTSSNKQILFEAGQKVGTQKNLTLTAGQYVMFYLVQDDSSSNLIADGFQSAPVFFSAFADLLNQDKFNHFQTDTPSDGELQLAIEDLTGGGDEDFNDVVLSVTSAAIVIPGSIGETVDAIVTLTGKEAVMNSEIGLLILDERSGRINNLLPTDADYATTALSERAIPLFTPNSAVGTSSTVSLEAGKYLGIYLIAGGTLSDWLLINSGNLNDTLPQAFFSTVSANPDGINHVNRFGSGRFALEDLWLGGDLDFDDASIQLRFN